MVLNCGIGEDSPESPLDCKEIQPVNPKGYQSWIFIGRTHAEAETLILWPPDAKHWFIGRDPDAGKDWSWEKKVTTEDEMVGWHHRLNGHEFGWTPGVGDGQGGLACCSPWGCKEWDTTEWLNWTKLITESRYVSRFLPLSCPSLLLSFWLSFFLSLNLRCLPSRCIVIICPFYCPSSSLLVNPDSCPKSPSLSSLTRQL